MASLVFVVLFAGSALLFGAGFVAALLAQKKGYRPWFWLISLGPVGALWMLLKPNLRHATTPEARDQWETHADWTGGILSGFTLFFLMGLPLFGMLAIFRVTAMPPAGAMNAATVIPTPQPVLEANPVDSSVTKPPATPVDAPNGTDAENPPFRATDD